MGRNGNIDLLKAAMCVMIVMIHAGYSFPFPVLRLGVPVFFIISSFLFFSKGDWAKAEKGLTANKQPSGPQENDREIWRRYGRLCRRAGLLYLFWFVVCLPVTAFYHNFDAMSPLELCRFLLLNIPFGTTFMASWYIPAYVIGIGLAVAFRRHTIIFLVLSVLTYSFCCLTTNYYYLIGERLLAPISDIGIFRFPYNSFPSGMIFVFYGMVMARLNRTPGIWRKRLQLSLTLCLAGAILLYGENRLASHLRCQILDDFYFSLMVLAPAVLAAVLGLPRQIKWNTIPLRKASVVTYCLHYSLKIAICYIVPGLSCAGILLIVLFICAAVSALMIQASRMPGLHWLRVAM